MTRGCAASRIICGRLRKSGSRGCVNVATTFRELLHDGCPVACVTDAPFGYVNVFRDHVNVGFFYGAMLDDSARLLEGTGKRMRHVKLKPGLQIDDCALSELINAAYLDIRARLWFREHHTESLGRS